MREALASQRQLQSLSKEFFLGSENCLLKYSAGGDKTHIHHVVCATFDLSAVSASVPHGDTR